MIAMLGSTPCAGCTQLVNIWFDGLRYTTRERSMSWSPVHLCEDPDKREHIEIPVKELIAFECWECGEHDVAPTSWGRIVEFPSDLSAAAWAEGWVGPLQEHLCFPPEAPKKRVGLEAYRVLTDGRR